MVKYTLKQFIGKLPTNCLSVFDHFVILALKGLKPFTFSQHDSQIQKKFLASLFPCYTDKYLQIDFVLLIRTLL